MMEKKFALSFILYLLVSAFFVDCSIIKSSFDNYKLRKKDLRLKKSHSRLERISKLNIKKSQSRRSKILILTIALITITVSKFATDYALENQKNAFIELFTQKSNSLIDDFTKIFKMKSILCDYSNTIFQMFRENNSLIKVKYAIEIEYFNPILNDDYQILFQNIQDLEKGADLQVKHICSLNFDVAGETMFYTKVYQEYNQIYQESMKKDDKTLKVVLEFARTIPNELFKEDNSLPNKTDSSEEISKTIEGSEIKTNSDEEKNAIQVLVGASKSIKAEYDAKSKSLNYAQSIIEKSQEIINKYYPKYEQLDENKKSDKTLKHLYLILIIFSTTHICLRLYVVYKAIEKAVETGDHHALDNLSDGKYIDIVKKSNDCIKAEIAYVNALNKNDEAEIKATDWDRKIAYLYLIWAIVKAFAIPLLKKFLKDQFPEFYENSVKFLPLYNLILDAVELSLQVGKYFTLRNSTKKLQDLSEKNTLYQTQIFSNAAYQIDFAKCLFTLFIIKRVASSTHSANNLSNLDSNNFSANQSSKDLKIKIFKQVCSENPNFCFNYFKNADLQNIMESEYDSFKLESDFYDLKGPITSVIPYREDINYKEYLSIGYRASNYKTFNTLYCKNCSRNFGLVGIKHITINLDIEKDSLESISKIGNLVNDEKKRVFKEWFSYFQYDIETSKNRDKLEINKSLFKHEEKNIIDKIYDNLDTKFAEEKFLKCFPLGNLDKVKKILDVYLVSFLPIQIAYPYMFTLSHNKVSKDKVLNYADTSNYNALFFGALDKIEVKSYNYLSIIPFDFVEKDKQKESQVNFLKTISSFDCGGSNVSLLASEIALKNTIFEDKEKKIINFAGSLSLNTEKNSEFSLTSNKIFLSDIQPFDDKFKFEKYSLKEFFLKMVDDTTKIPEFSKVYKFNDANFQKCFEKLNLYFVKGVNTEQLSNSNEKSIENRLCDSLTDSKCFEMNKNTKKLCELIVPGYFDLEPSVLKTKFFPKNEDKSDVLKFDLFGSGALLPNKTFMLSDSLCQGWNSFLTLSKLRKIHGSDILTCQKKINNEQVFYFDKIFETTIIGILLLPIRLKSGHDYLNFSVTKGIISLNSSQNPNVLKASLKSQFFIEIQFKKKIDEFSNFFVSGWQSLEKGTNSMEKKMFENDYYPFTPEIENIDDTSKAYEIFDKDFFFLFENSSHLCYQRIWIQYNFDLKKASEYCGCTIKNSKGSDDIVDCSTILNSDEQIEVESSLNNQHGLKKIKRIILKRRYLHK